MTLPDPTALSIPTDLLPADGRFGCGPSKVRSAIVVLNNARPGNPHVQLEELESHFRTRVRAVVRMPYDPHIAAGSAIVFRDLQPETRLAARDLAATVVEGLRTLASASAA